MHTIQLKLNPEEKQIITVTTDEYGTKKVEFLNKDYKSPPDIPSSEVVFTKDQYLEFEQYVINLRDKFIKYK